MARPQYAQIPSAILAARNHLVDVVGQITQTKSGSVLRPVAGGGNRRYFYRTAQDQRCSDRGAGLNLAWFHGVRV